MANGSVVGDTAIPMRCKLNFSSKKKRLEMELKLGPSASQCQFVDAFTPMALDRVPTTVRRDCSVLFAYFE